MHIHNLQSVALYAPPAATARTPPAADPVRTAPEGTSTGDTVAVSQRARAVLQGIDAAKEAVVPGSGSPEELAALLAKTLGESGAQAVEAQGQRLPARWQDLLAEP